MATSGSTNYNQTRYDIITDALTLLGVYGVGRTISADDMDVGNRFLNKMVKAWSTKGLHLWAKEEGVLYLTQYKGEYILDPSSTSVYFTKKSDEVTTKLNANMAASATNVTVLSTTGMTVGDYIGVVLDTKTLHWTTIAAIPTSTTLTLITGVPSVASSGGFVFTFTSKGEKPLRILDARLVQGMDLSSSTTQSELGLESISYEDYFSTSSVTNNGTPNQFHYNPKITTGKVFVWPRPTNCSMRIQYSYERVLEDFDNTTDNPDFPAEWLEPLTYQLAVRLGPVFGKDERAMTVLYPIASVMLENLLNWDNEITSITFQQETY